MPLRRHFLDWSKPVLPLAVRWLAEHHPASAAPGTWDLSRLTAVTPVRRGGRRLTELLVEAAEARGLTLLPPAAATVGGLLDKLCARDPADTHADPLADPLTAQLTRTRALADLPPGRLAALIPHPPEHDDLLGWWTLAGELQAVADDLAAARLTPADVLARHDAGRVDAGDPARWAALAEAEAAYHAALADAGLTDPQAARLAALDAGRCAADAALVLIDTVDLTTAQRDAIRLAAEAGTTIDVLIHAPPDHADRFDDTGGLRVDAWSAYRPALPADRVRFVDRPADQAEAVLATVHAWAADDAGDPLSVDRLTVGLGDERTLAGPVRRAFEAADLTARYAAGRPLAQSRPVLLLDALARFAATRRFDDLALLLRHPDVETYAEPNDETHGFQSVGVDRTDTPTPAEAHGPQSMGSDDPTPTFLTLLDRYATDHLQARLTGDWLGNPDTRARLKALHDAVAALLPPDADTPRPLPDRSPAITAALTAVYDRVTLDRSRPDDQALADALGQVAEALTEQAGLDPAAPSTPAVTFAQAASLTVARLRAAAVPEPGGPPAVELMGYLDVALDDAPAVILTGFNDAAVPASRPHDPLLPDTLRAALGLDHDARRLARDTLRLAQLTHSRPRLAVIAGRQSADGDPLSPSRLLLACDDDQLVARLRAFYDPAPARTLPQAGATPPRLQLLTPGPRDRFLIPYPTGHDDPINELPVTAFRDYLACPYRFYLKRVCRLRGIDDAAVELDAPAFGNLAHGVLDDFGRSPLTASTDTDAIAGWLLTRLDDRVARGYGRPDRLRAAVRLQVEQLRDRLRAFAEAQAADAAAGWRIVAHGTERQLRVTLDVDGEPFTVTGRVDRIDHHDTHGYRVLDYKTGDAPAKPDTAHTRGRGDARDWVDLQLPLYRDLCRAITGDAPVALGYFTLPRKLDAVSIAVADWGDADLAEAAAVRDGVIRGVRGRVFWPPADPPAWPDDLESICADLAHDRAELIAASETGAR